MGTNASVEAAEPPRVKPAADQSQQGDRAQDKPGEPVKTAVADASAAAYAPGASSQLKETTSQSAQANLPRFDGFTDSEKALGRQDKIAERNPVKEILDKVGKPENPQPPMSAEGQALLTTAEKHIKVPGYPNAEQEFAKFKRDVEVFEREAREKGVSPQEVKDTYKGIDRLLQSSGPGKPGVTDGGMPSDRQRVRVAEQLMNMVAFPEDRQQGSYDTCAMASVEGMLLSGKDRQPSKVTSMVADVALTGQTNVRGIDVKIDKGSMQSFGEHADNRAPGENKQRLAENIFRVTTANVYYGIKRAEGSPEGQLSYHSGRDGNRVKYTPDAKDASRNNPEYAEFNTPEGRVAIPAFAATMTGESRILNQITGKDYSDRLIVNADTKGEDPRWVKTVSSQAELDRQLKTLERDGKLPAALAVYTGNPAFSDGQNPFAALSGGDKRALQETFKRLYADGHSLLVTGSMGGGADTSFNIKNTWGAESSKSLMSKELYDTTKPVSPNQIVNQLQFWKIDNVDERNKKQMDNYADGLDLAATYIVAGYMDRAGNNPNDKNDYVSAAKRLGDIMDGMPKSYQQKTQREEAEFVKKMASNPRLQEFYRAYKELFGR